MCYLWIYEWKVVKRIIIIKKRKIIKETIKTTLMTYLIGIINHFYLGFVHFIIIFITTRMYDFVLLIFFFIFANKSRHSLLFKKRKKVYEVILHKIYLFK